MLSVINTGTVRFYLLAEDPTEKSVGAKSAETAISLPGASQERK